MVASQERERVQYFLLSLLCMYVNNMCCVRKVCNIVIYGFGCIGGRLSVCVNAMIGPIWLEGQGYLKSASFLQR